ncbi:MAG: Ig-like domain-containing protein, partial [Acidimicrobiales bacterium]
MNFVRADGQNVVATRNVQLALASRNAEEVRLSEDSTFTGVFFDPFATPLLFTLSESGGVKTIYAEFRSPTGAQSAPISIDITFVDQGPVIESFDLTDGQIVSRPLTVNATVTALLGLADVEFRVDGAVVYSDPSGSLSFWWDPRTLAPGDHRVTLFAIDSAGNTRAVERTIAVDLLPPPAPTIDFPLDGAVLGATVVTVAGTAEPFSPVTVSRNGSVQGTQNALSDGRYSIAGVLLVEGQNTLVAQAEDAIGLSAATSSVVTVDTGPPPAPELNEATPLAGGLGIRLLWSASSTGEQPVSYEVHRSPVPFSTASPATLVIEGLKQFSHGDLGLADGLYYYGIVGVDLAGNSSALSNVLSVEFDGTPPSFAISYGTGAPVPPGPLPITLTTNEALVSTPSLTIRPQGARAPLSVLLQTINGLEFTGSLNIDATTPSGPATVSVSGRDLAGNFTSGTPVGPALVLDTDGPTAAIAVGAEQPIQITSDVDVPVTLTPSEPVKPGTQPLLQFTPPLGSPIVVPLASTGAAWSGSLSLGPGMGVGIGNFSFSAQDALGNLGTLIVSGAGLEVYDAVAPLPADPPVQLTAVSKPGGEIQLNWIASERAETYQLLRKSGPCDADPAGLVASGLATTSASDVPAADGTYCYGVASERLGAVSALSPLVEVVSDRRAPGAPEALAVALAPIGVQITWDAPSSGELPARYIVYENGAPIATIEGGTGGSFA